MFEDIIPAPQKQPDKSDRPFHLNRKIKITKQTKTPKVLDKRLYPYQPQSSLSELVAKLEDLNQLIQILEIAKNKVKRQKIKQRKNRKIKW